MGAGEADRRALRRRLAVDWAARQVRRRTSLHDLARLAERRNTWRSCPSRSLTGYDNEDATAKAAKPRRGGLPLRRAANGSWCARPATRRRRPEGVLDDSEATGEGVGLVVDRPKSGHGPANKHWLAGEHPRLDRRSTLGESHLPVALPSTTAGCSSTAPTRSCPSDTNRQGRRSTSTSRRASAAAHSATAAASR